MADNRHSNDGHQHQERQDAPRGVVTDRVCGMTVDPATAAYRHDLGGTLYYFRRALLDRIGHDEEACYLAVDGHEHHAFALGTMRVRREIVARIGDGSIIGMSYDPASARLVRTSA